jgi:hypothetical protein
MSMVEEIHIIWTEVYLQRTLMLQRYMADPLQLRTLILYHVSVEAEGEISIQAVQEEEPGSPQVRVCSSQQSFLLEECSHRQIKIYQSNQ